MQPQPQQQQSITLSMLAASKDAVSMYPWVSFRLNIRVLRPALSSSSMSSKLVTARERADDSDPPASRPSCLKKPILVVVLLRWRVGKFQRPAAACPSEQRPERVAREKTRRQSIGDRDELADQASRLPHRWGERMRGGVGGRSARADSGEQHLLETHLNHEPYS